MKSEANTTRQEYIRRINEVLDYVEKNLDANLSLEQLSEKAYYSSFHFHRIFSAIIGETINELVNRKRIERIASVLLTGYDKPLKELAYQYGFNSDSSFSRAFKKYYGVSPTEFKLDGKNILLSKIGIEPLTLEKYICSIDKIKKWLNMNAQIVVMELPEIKLAGITNTGEFEEMGKAYQELMKWGAQKGVLNLSDFKAITIYHDNPRVTQLSKVRHSACVTINQEIEADGAIRPLAIQKGDYAIGHFEITADLFQKAWDSMCVWVVENGHSFRDSDYFEVYHNDHKTHPEQKFIIDICIPVVKGNDATTRSPKQGNLSYYKEQMAKGQIRIDYSRLIAYLKSLRVYFHKEYASDFILGKIYQGSMDFSYFSLTTPELKKQKLKFVLIFDHEKMQFSICLSGQNKSIRKKYWELFRGSDWNKYHLVESIDNSLSIIDTVIVEKPDFDDTNTLTKQIETESLKFMDDIKEVLE
ncbi:MAG: AraC family transcriptional regulator [Chitinophagales bacterium]|nr:AraC family transcriptional regulator [Chitinophagales bacterium]